MSSRLDDPLEPSALLAVEALERQHWRRTRTLTLVLLGLWLAVAVSAPWFARDLDRWHIGRFPIGFWLNAQGAILIFVLLIALYAWIMDRLDLIFLNARARLESPGIAAERLPR